MKSLAHTPCCGTAHRELILPYGRPTLILFGYLAISTGGIRMRLHYLCVGTDRVLGWDLFTVSVRVSYTNTIYGPIKVRPWKKATPSHCGAKCHLRRPR